MLKIVITDEVMIAIRFYRRTSQMAWSHDRENEGPVINKTRVIQQFFRHLAGRPTFTELLVLLRDARYVWRSGKSSDDFLTLFDATMEESETKTSSRKLKVEPLNPQINKQVYKSEPRTIKFIHFIKLVSM